MKKTVIASLAAVGLFSGASAYTVSFLNIAAADNTAVPVLDNTGAAIGLGSGFVAAGTFAQCRSGRLLAAWRGRALYGRAGCHERVG